MEDWGLFFKRIFAVIGLIAFIGGLMFLVAGRLDWVGAWTFLLLFLAFLLTVAIWGTLKMPELMEERSKVGGNVKAWDKVIMTLYTILFFGTFAIAALDAGRFRWSVVPPVAQLSGIVGLFLGGALAAWVMVTNAYASRFVRIQ
ncbi:MAG: hypothetical protein KGJ80_18835, partial [Chloroflexota bacterium]|nr:hypothetical protein [Chloroflexota bacterium]